MSVYTVMQDTLRNWTSAIGTSKDKSTSNVHIFVPLAVSEAEAAYRDDWCAQKVIDIPAYDATSKWRSWSANPKQITALDQIETAFNVKLKVRVALQMARLYGGAALVMGINDDDPATPLNLNTVKQGSLKFLHAVTRYEISAQELERNVLSPYFGVPKGYLVQGETMQAQVHPSRLVRFSGKELISRNLSPDGWGDSVLQAINQALKQFAAANASVATLIQESKFDIIKVPGLLENITTAGFQSKLTERFTYANVAKSTINALLLDGAEEWQRLNVDFNGLPDLIKLYALFCCSAADIPATRFLGQSAVGLNATGDGDLRNYYDKIKSEEQEGRMTPAMGQLDEVLIRSALGSRPPELYYNWNPLWQMGPVEKAAYDKTRAETFKIDVDSALLNPDTMKKAREGVIIEDNVYPGFEKLVADEPIEQPLDEENEEVIAQEEEQEVLTEDARPRTLYVRRDVLNSEAIVKWAKEQGFETVVDDLHVTLIYSRTPVDWLKIGEQWSGYDDKGTLRVKPGGPRLIEKFGDNAVVLAFSNTELQWRHQHMRECGASFDYDEYTPHVTISYLTNPRTDISNIEPYRGEIVLGPEIFEEIKPHEVTES